MYVKRSIVLTIIIFISIILSLTTSQIEAINNKQWQGSGLETYSHNNIGEYTDSNGIQYAYHPELSTARVIGYIGSETDVYIPESFAYNEVLYTVIAIDDAAFYGQHLKRVIIPDSVTTIGVEAFYDNALIHVELGNSVTTIRESAFQNNELSNMVIPDSVISIGSLAFEDNQLVYLKIGNKTTTIGSSAFSNNQLTTLDIPNSVTTIKENTFSNNQLTTINLGQSLAAIGDQAFAQNQLSMITIPSCVTTIGSAVFSGNPLEEIYTVDGHSASLQNLLQPSTMSDIDQEYTKLLETTSRYSNNVSLENMAYIGNDLTFAVIPKQRYVHNNATTSWHEHTPIIQWFKDEQLLIAETNLHLSHMQLEDAGVYYAVVDEEKLPDIMVVIKAVEQTGTSNLHEDKQLKQTQINEQVQTNDYTKGINLYSITSFISLISITIIVYRSKKHRT